MTEKPISRFPGPGWRDDTNAQKKETPQVTDEIERQKERSREEKDEHSSTDRAPGSRDEVTEV